MKSLIEFFINRSLLVNLISVIVLVVGILSAFTLKKDTFPEVDFDVITVSTIYPGTVPEDVEKLVTIELERKVKEVDGIEELNAMSLEGRSILFLKIDPDYEAQEVLADIKDAVDSVNDLPEAAKSPVVTMRKNTQRSILRIALMGKNEIERRKVAKDLRDQIELISGVAKVDLSGYRKEEIVVEIFPKKLNHYQVTVDEVAQAIKGRNMNLSGGKLETESAEFLIRTKGEFENIDDIKNVVVRSNN
ncbi:MAG: efflux RND transporter permease subunit, partial [Bacteriovoracales bacterium]|nr:efflux RND transporter permease subunit [Bacteriovoracales bacterium]